MRASDATGDKSPCKRCKKPARRLVSASSFKFEHRPDSPAPQNTGASSVDHDVDVVIGRNAEANLREFQKRQDFKRRLIAMHNTTGDHLSRLDGGDYFVMTDQERVAAKKARLANQEATKKIRAWQKEHPRSSREVGWEKGEAP